MIFLTLAFLFNRDGCWIEAFYARRFLLYNVSGHNPDLLPYTDLFLENHITGKLLLNLSVDNLTKLGIKSLGHALDLFVSIS